MAIAQTPIEPAAKQVGIVRRVQGVHLASEIVERLAVVELAFEGGKGVSELDRRVQLNGTGKLVRNGQHFAQSGHRKSPFGEHEQRRW
jgi:hypothetical protein